METKLPRSPQEMLLNSWFRSWLEEVNSPTMSKSLCSTTASVSDGVSSPVSPLTSA